ncbi:calcium ion binding, partial [Homalodisca vitripennis]
RVQRLSRDNRIKQRRAWLLLGWVTCPCKQPACPVISGGSEATCNPLVTVRDYRDLRLPPSVYQQAVALLRNNLEFTVAASLRQEEFNSGTIVAFSHGFNRYVKSRWWIQQFKQLVTFKFLS